MADLEKIVKLIFEGDGTKLETELKKVGKDFDNFSGNIQDATGPLADFGKKVALAEAALITLGVAGLVYAFNKAKEFEGGVIELDKVLSDEEGLSGGLDLAKKKSIEFSDTYGESSKNVISSIADFKQANFTLIESIQLSEDAMRLKIAGDLEAAEASQFLKQILSGFRAEASDASIVIDTLNAVSNKYNTNVRELAIGMGDLSGVASTVNMTYAETAGILTPVIAVFGSGSEAAQALKTGLLRMVADTPTVVAAMESIGVSQRGANGELKNAYDILGEVSRAFETTDESQQLFIAGEIFGTMQAAKMVQVIRDWSNVLDITAVALDSVGSAQLEVDKRLAASEVAVSRLIEGYVNLNLMIGDKFRSSATGAINSLTDIENALRNSLGDETFDVVWDAINSFFENTETLFKTIATNLPEALAGVDFSGLVDALKDLGGEVGDALDSLFGGELDLTTVDGLQEAIQKVIDGITLLTNVTSGFIEGLKPKIAVIGEAIEKFSEMDESTQKNIGDTLGWAESINSLFKALDTIKDVIVPLAGFALSASLVSSITTIATNVSAIAAGSSGVLATALFGAVAVPTAIIAGIYSIGEAVDFLLEKPGQMPADFWASFWNELTGKGGELTTDQQAWYDGMIKAAQKSGEESADEYIGEINKGFADFNKTADQLIKDLGLSDEWEAEKKRIEENKITPKAAIDDVQSQFKNLGLDVDWQKVKSEIEKNPINPAVDMLDEIKMEVIGYFNGEEVWGEIEKAIPAEKIIEVKPTILEQAKLDLERELTYVSTTAENIQTAMEWSAKVDIAEVEADAKRMESAFDSVGASVVAISGNIDSMLAAWTGGDLSFVEKSQARRFLEEQLELQRESQKIENQLLKSQIKYQEIKNKKLENGEMAKIEIDTSGVEPALEMVMWQIIEKVQVRANENAQEFLKGIPT